MAPPLLFGIAGMEESMETRRREAWTDRNRRAAGYSLSEILVVVALIGIFVLFGGPALGEAYRSYKVRTAANNLTTDLRAQRYLAVTNRATRTLTVNRVDHSTAPNQYSYLNPLGRTMTVTFDGVEIENTSDTSVAFTNRGATTVTATLNVIFSMDIDSTRGDRYTVSITPTGQISSAYSTYTP